MQDTEEPKFVRPPLIEEGTYADAWERRRARFFGVPYDREQTNALRGIVAWKRYELAMTKWRERKRHDNGR